MSTAGFVGQIYFGTLNMDWLHSLSLLPMLNYRQTKTAVTIITLKGRSKDNEWNGMGHNSLWSVITFNLVINL